MSKMIKRKDGSYSKRGLWDNIRANKGSGKEPTKEMLKQESKIKKEENMNSMYKKGGKTSKKKVMKEARKEGESFMEESKEIHFDAPGVKPPKKYAIGGLLGDPLKGPVDKNLQNPNPPARPKEVTDAINSSVSSKKNNPPIETGIEATSRQNKEEAKALLAGKKKMMGGKYENGGPAGTTKSRTVETNPTGTYKTITKTKSVNTPEEQSNSVKTKTRRTIKGALKDAGEDFKYNLDSVLDELEERKEARKDKKSVVEGAGKGAASTMKKGGAKTMEPGGGGRFAAMVGKLKGQGKSEESAEAIAASAGRKKYGKSRFQSMAAAGKKKMMGGKKC
jgi:hypothetical protein